MPTINLLPRRNKKTETLSYSLKDEPIFAVEMGLGEREYMHTETTTEYQKAIDRFASINLLLGQKKRLSLKLKDGRNFVLKREIK